MNTSDLFPWHQLPWDLSSSSYPRDARHSTPPNHPEQLNLSKKHDQLARELWLDIQAGKVRVYTVSGVPIRTEFVNLSPVGHEAPRITLNDGNCWLAERGYLEKWQPTPPPIINEPESGNSKSRKDSLTPVIERAQLKCRDPSDTAEVWNALVALAKSQVYPLFGLSPEGIQYHDNQDEAEVLTKGALRKRLKRQQARGR